MLLQLYTRMLTTQAALTPRERLSAISDLNPSAGGHLLTNKWFVLLGWSMILLLLLLLVAVRQMRKEKEKAQKERSFNDQADSLNLTPEERDVIKAIAGLSGIKHQNMIFSMRDAFNSGLAKLKQQTLSQKHDPQAWAQLQAVEVTMKEKLGFSEQKLTGLNNRSSKDQTSRQIPEGTEVVVSLLDDTLGRTFQATITANHTSELCLECSEPLACKSGDVWIVQFQNGVITWEFQAITIDYSDPRLRVSHSDYIRFVSRRRFAQVTTQKSARIALFPAFQEAKQDLKSTDIPFHPAELIEMSGPCLRFRTQIDVTIRQRVLVVLELKPDVVLQDVGQVREIQQDGKKQTVLIEVIGLNQKDIDKLAQIANQIAFNNSSQVNTIVETEYAVKE